ncbi:Hypothetical predicted protein [Octopus vulgaris]|uniref:Uncharacterized protein n=1 Tax=Octopus vulgaris TaxID=6645 RepID=A0AA36BEQ4_OCTVU|nr:Hypothetical predicted protein [Octopus vulgaris]
MIASLKIMEETSHKKAMTPAERKRLQRQRQKAKDPDFQKKENERLRLLRNGNRAMMSPSELREQRKKDRVRQHTCRDKKKRVAIEKKEASTPKSKDIGQHQS